MQNPESILENEMLRILQNFDVKTDRPIPIRRPNLVLAWFGLVWFYSISTTVDYLMPNPFLYI